MLKSVGGNVQQGVKGRIFNIQKFSTEDGPGLRTTVFFQGCPLRCLWCHNPEGLVSSKQLIWTDHHCLACHACRDRCPTGAISYGEDQVIIDRTNCDGCGKCSDYCPGGALAVIGQDITPTELLTEISKDLIFFQTSQGGVTLSGGECTVQVDFLKEFLALAKAAGIHTAVDTCGYNRLEVFEQILPFTDLFLYDIKLMNREKHKQYTGVYPEVIQDNARFLAAQGAKMWIRIPLIPGLTDDLGDISAAARFIKDLNTVERVDLLTYNNLCLADYARLDKPYSLHATPLMDRSKTEDIQKIMWEAGLTNVRIAGVFQNEE